MVDLEWLTKFSLEGSNCARFEDLLDLIVLPETLSVASEVEATAFGDRGHDPYQLCVFLTYQHLQINTRKIDDFLSQVLTTNLT